MTSRDCPPLLIIIQHRQKVQFIQADLLNPGIDQVFDFVYIRVWTGSWPAQGELLQGIRRKLSPGGILLLEVAPLSGYQAYAYNHAFARSMELIGLLETLRAGAAAQPEPVQALLQQAGFEVPERSTGLPAFIPRNDHRIKSLALEACRDAILHCRGSTTDELNALLLELREFEQQDDTLISRPGLLQLVAWPSQSTPATIR